MLLLLLQGCSSLGGRAEVGWALRGSSLPNTGPVHGLLLLPPPPLPENSLGSIFLVLWTDSVVTAAEACLSWLPPCLWPQALLAAPTASCPALQGRPGGPRVDSAVLTGAHSSISTVIGHGFPVLSESNAVRAQDAIQGSSAVAQTKARHEAVTRPELSPECQLCSACCPHPG